jgi:hypothetical protein
MLHIFNENISLCCFLAGHVVTIRAPLLAMSELEVLLSIFAFHFLDNYGTLWARSELEVFNLSLLPPFSTTRAPYGQGAKLKQLFYFAFLLLDY